MKMELFEEHEHVMLDKLGRSLPKWNNEKLFA
jgi:hypothetical protein